MAVAIVGLILLPILFNPAVMSIEAGAQLPATLGGALIRLTGLSLVVTLIPLFAIYLSTRTWPAKLPTALRLSSRIFLATSTAIIFSYVAGFLMPLAWLR